MQSNTGATKSGQKSYSRSLENVIGRWNGYSLARNRAVCHLYRIERVGQGGAHLWAHAQGRLERGQVPALGVCRAGMRQQMYGAYRASQDEVQVLAGFDQLKESGRYDSVGKCTRGGLLSRQEGAGQQSHSAGPRTGRDLRRCA